MPHAALTTITMRGEYNTYGVSAMCETVTTAKMQLARRAGSNANKGVLAAGLMHLAAHEADAETTLHELEKVIRGLTSTRPALSVLVDCTAFVTSIHVGREVRALLARYGPIALTVAVAHGHVGVALQCKGTEAPKTFYNTSSANVNAVAAGDLVWASGIPSRDVGHALAAADVALQAGGSSLARAMRCTFYMRSNMYLFHVFDAYRAAFNRKGIAGPTRAEFEAQSDVCPECNVIVKCFGTVFSDSVQRASLHAEPGFEELVMPHPMP
jgi:hypothetical protein